MLLVISSENEMAEEAVSINQLFASGMCLFHLRKPKATREECRSLLNAIDIKFHGYIMLHQYYDLCKEYQLKGIHLKESFRKELGAKGSEYVTSFQDENYTVSTSFHSLAMVNSNVISFDYCLLSPVFDSVSKQGYTGRTFDVSNIKTTIIALGGIQLDTISKTTQLGYNGIAVLGAIWKQKDPTYSFKKIKESYESNFNDVG